MSSNTVDTVEKDEKGRFRVPPDTAPPPGGWPTGLKSVNQWMVLELSTEYPEGLPQDFWERIVRVVNEEREAKNIWESEEKGKAAMEEVLQKSRERLEKLPRYWKDGKFTNEKWTNNFISVRRLPPPDWMKDSVTQSFYVWRQNRDEVSNKRYLQALESGEMHHEFFKTLRRKEREEREAQDKDGTPPACDLCEGQSCPSQTSTSVGLLNAGAKRGPKKATAKGVKPVGVTKKAPAVKKPSVATKAKGAVKKTEGAITGNAAKKAEGAITGNATMKLLPRRRMANGASHGCSGSRQCRLRRRDTQLESDTSQICQYSGLAVTIGSLVKPHIHRSFY
ncbi:hypothetical protein HYFRA_00011538 [Hymenoscyphus fraxineus]|uniref:Uncharacterized protein n=1 Tax=Hymenoscyphus fraxineus TaxID=746836 RepID=A0A9N9L513_9HELO|nr:hypothetical protein HYFRA_00011538 [Hymenoscyphus fraxineus]